MPTERPLLFAAVWLPRFQLQAVLRTDNAPRHVPFAVLDSDLQMSVHDAENKGRILHANEIAERAGVAAGMTPSQALARCGKLALRHRIADEEARASDELRQCAAQWTPDYEASQPGLCVLDLSRVRNVCEQNCGEQIRQWLAQRELEARVGFAANADMACLAARATDAVLLLDDRGDDWRALLQGLPVAVLQPSAHISEVLQLWGVRTLAQLAALPRADIAARLGMEGAMLRDMAAGGRERLLRLVRPVVDFREEMELEHSIESMEPLLFVLRRMLDNLCDRLASVWLVASAQRVVLRFEDKSTHERILRVAEPTRNAELLLRVLHTHLDSVSAAAPIAAVCLELTPTRSANVQTNLFERTLRDPNRFAETLAQLEAMLGAGNVGKVRLLPSRRPDAFALVNYLDASAATADTNESRESITHGLPLRCYRPPKPVSVLLQDGKPATLQTAEGHLTVTHSAQPCLLSGDWWDRHAWEREVWEIAASDGALYQLAREKQRWMLDGVFG